jgi:REP element-mobilizing transposase RayT
MTESRRRVLTGERLGTLASSSLGCAGFGTELLDLDGQDDHVHRIVASRHRARRGRRLLNCLRGISARWLRQRDQVHTYSTHRGQRAT